MSSKLPYNNIGVSALSIAFVVRELGSISLAKALLILPFITHKELLGYLSNSNVKVQGLEKLIIEKTSHFSNFNQRYYDNLCNSLNAIQLLSEIEIAKITDSSISVDSEFSCNDAIGNRATKVFKASKNIAVALSGGVENIYLNLRIEL